MFHVALVADYLDCPPDAGRASRRRARLVTVITATVAAFAASLVAGPLAGIDLNVRSGDATLHVGPVAVIIVSALAGLVAWALAAALERSVSRPRLVWTAIALIALALSTAGPLTLGIGGATQGALLTMHYLVGGALIAGIRPTIRRR